jgi:hypothetical protein
MIALVLQVALLVLLSTAVHGAATAFLVGLVVRMGAHTPGGHTLFIRIFSVPMIVLFLLLVGVGEAALWACYYWHSGDIAQFSESLYFSLITMTTVGYGDITLKGPGRLVSGIQAALGIVLFGWTTSVIFSAVQTIQRVYLSTQRPDR